MFAGPGKGGAGRARVTRELALLGPGVVLMLRELLQKLQGQKEAPRDQAAGEESGGGGSCLFFFAPPCFVFLLQGGGECVCCSCFCCFLVLVLKHNLSDWRIGASPSLQAVWDCFGAFKETCHFFTGWWGEFSFLVCSTHIPHD